MGLRALISVSDKTGLSDFVKGLHAHGFTILSTGGTAKAIRDAGVPCSDVSEYTQSPEVMDGRVKTLHPRVHGGILMRDTEADREQLTKLLGGEPIDLVVVNLYPFAATVAKGAPFDVCIENIDIGGPTMVRAAAKNHARVTVLVEPSDYAGYLASLPAGPDSKAKSMYALKAFSHTATYDTAVAEWMQGQLCEGRTAVQELKYGCNPHQKPASVRGLLSPQGPQPLPFTVLSGTPGYINLLDALNAWQLVRELGEATGLPAAASFKHVSPAGAAVYAPLTPDMMEVYEAAGKELSHTAIAYLRSRQADPLCSFGDFVAISTTVDASTAALLKIEVSFPFMGQLTHHHQPLIPNTPSLTPSGGQLPLHIPHTLPHTPSGLRWHHRAGFRAGSARHPQGQEGRQVHCPAGGRRLLATGRGVADHFWNGLPAAARRRHHHRSHIGQRGDGQEGVERRRQA
jgi:phosphoribosylaminoimidazolecarboxamide formyltransferase/IMP cyclohydrolase